MNLAKQLRAAVAESGKTVNGISTASGVPQAVLQRFMTGERDIRLDTVQRLADYFGLQFAPATKQGKAPDKPTKPRTKPTRKAKPRAKGSPTVARVRRFVDDYGLAEDVGGVVNHLPRGHVKRGVIASMLRSYRNEPSMRAWRRRGEYR